MASTQASGHFAEKYRQNFLDLFPLLVEELTKEGQDSHQILDALKHLKEVLQYNVPHGKLNRGLMVIGSLCHLLGLELMTPELENKAIALGWCIEWLQAFFLVADDIMDQSLTRRGQPCWYKKTGIGLVAINDSFLIEGTLYLILKNHFKSEPYYINIMELFHEITYQTEMGQCLDLITSPAGDSVDLNSFTIERYNAIVKYKTAFYSFYLPVALAMHMAGISDERSHTAAKNILLVMGEFFQIQDDYLDCYGDPKVTGKVGTDIEESKCSWLIVQALKRANADQRKTLEECYGKNDPSCVKIVKEVYTDLKLEEVYREYEEESYKKLMDTIKEELVGTKLPSGMFHEFAERIYKRKK
ncbi:PREDICTED: farnesyl pyrophosphate synthase-like [Amphimedon queenslandica]|uniref:Farnesyl pyrophosphate synthase n=1 Tax=Amphimedon queenslandica TaxID=400682 RepID=A0AAN0J3K1_AMPQE|nr:PREDICTED: farnesyl pyrophosphate synthase-like [Amphimedon queenslandica]|eukprot:XP_019851306.1 PREDICTED: farnesyl pyrophosphate synthase-like [Amphimedon queenslandica]